MAKSDKNNINDKRVKSIAPVNVTFFMVLSIQQLYRISTMYWDDKYGTHSVSPEVNFILYYIFAFHCNWIIIEHV